jgi:predicted RNase H-like nuclease (RuvC/YqgF family)
LTAEDTHDKDLFSTLFPKERSGRRTGLGLLAGGVGSTRISEALFEMQEVKEENKKLWDVVKTLMSNQTKLEQQYSELKSQVSGSQKCPSIETSPRFDTVDGQHLHDKNEDNQESISHLNKRHGVELEVNCVHLS